MSNIYLGIDIGGTSVKIGLVDSLGNIISTAAYSVAFDNYNTPILDTVLKSTDIFLAENNFDFKLLKGIGVSATGQIDSVLGTVAGSGGNIKNWVGAAIKESFFKKYQLPVTVINDANCVALGEKWVGAAKSSSNFIVITIGTGLGGGIIVNDNILLGQFGYGGELGHFSINNKGRACTCGNLGCYEQYASMTALIKDVKNHLLSLGKPAQNIDGKFIFDSINAGNKDIALIVDEWIDNISTGLVSLIHIFNPELVLIGGGVSVQKEMFIDKVRTKVLSKIMPNFKNNFNLLPAILANNAGLVGAVYYNIKNNKGD